VFNIQKAVSRLSFAPKLNEIEITDIKNGIGVFTPKADKPVSFAALKETLKKAGYTLASAKITVAGKLARDGRSWSLAADASNQRFTLLGDSIDQALPDAAPGAQAEVSGDWKTEGVGNDVREVITPSTTKKAERSQNEDGDKAAETEYVDVASGEPMEGSPTVAPIRTTSPGLTVYRGGAFVPRYVYTRQRLGGLTVDRQTLLIGFSYTPTPKLLVEVELPVMRISFKDRRSSVSGDGAGIGNITLSGKYRFFRQVETWGDRQAALRFGLELPTGKKDAPGDQLQAPAFVRQQLSPISGGLSPHIDLTYSQAKGRFIFGGNAEAIFRSERDGFRMGHELRVNTDFEYVLFPRKYDRPGGEVFAILETNFIRRGAGRVGGLRVAGSSSTEYYLAPGIQYAMHPRFVIEGSFQLPVVRDAGPQVLRVERNVVVGVRFLY
jgi:hypothetical protein